MSVASVGAPMDSTGSPNELGYRVPPADLQAFVDAPRESKMQMSPNGLQVAITATPGLPPIGVVAQPLARLAGMRFNPSLRLDARFEFGTALTLLSVETGHRTVVTGFPTQLQIIEGAWSPDSLRFAVTILDGGAVRLWIVDTRTGNAQRGTDQPINAIVDRGFQWLGATNTLLLRLRPEHEGAAPQAPLIPAGPNIQQTQANAVASQLTTFEDLLKTPFDDTRLDYFLSAQMAVLATDSLQRIGPVERLLDVDAAPDGTHLLVTRLKRPYSRIVPWSQFPTTVEVWDRHGQLLTTLATTPLVEIVAPGPDAVNPGPREFGWRADRAATVYWVEAQDGGDPRSAAAVRDIVYSRDLRGATAAIALAALPQRFRHIYWGQNDLALVMGWTWSTRDAALWRVVGSPASPDLEAVLQWNIEDRYGDPGLPMTRSNANGASMLRERGSGVWMTGLGASAEGDRPFLRVLDLHTKCPSEVWRSSAPYFERVVTLLDEQGEAFVTVRESIDTPANLVVHYRGDAAGRALTDWTNPTPQMAGATKQVIRYPRPDGVELTADLYLPAGYDAARDGPLPTLLWAYPQEFKSAAAASQVTGSPFRFNAISFSGPLPFLARGFAVLDHPTMPVIGEGATQPNDTYIEQLTANASAAIDEVVRRGVSDRNRMAIGGHSYGAFMTANLLAHTRLFKAGIARSGAYNRTLTPFGFQAEDRNFWQAQQTYLGMSPFVYASQIKDPLLLIHGEMDNNSGTFPIQSERLFQAIKGLGGTARLVMLPNESHGYRARESVLHMLWEEDQWLTRYVKEARP